MKTKGVSQAVIGFVVGGVILVVGVGIFLASNLANNSKTANTTSSNTTILSNNTKAVYTNYTKEGFTTNKTDLNALFFHAAWCPTCQLMEKDLQKNFNDLSDVSIWKVNFDTETELKTQYKVNTQSTWVLVDKTGKELSRGSSFILTKQIKGLVDMTRESLPSQQSSSISSSINSSLVSSSSSQPVEAQKTGVYQPYSASALQATQGKVVLFFNASWCPSCQYTKQDIEKNLNSIPGDVTILSVDYDNSTSLKQKYGVTYQHTFVQVNKEGEQLKKSTGLRDLAEIVEFLKS